MLTSASKRFRCEPCDEDFVYESVYKRHLVSRSHQQYVDNLDFLDSFCGPDVEPVAQGEKNLSLVWFVLKQLGIRTPSLTSMKNFKLPEMEAPLRCLGNYDVAKNVKRYPVYVEDTFREIYHANQWPCFASPMAILTDKSAVFVKDCVSFNHSSLGCVKGVIKKFFHKDVSHEIFAEVDMLLDLHQFQHMVPDTVAVHLDRGCLILYGCIIVPVLNILGLAEKPHLIVRWESQHFFRMDSQETAAYLSSHPLKEKFNKPVVMLPLILFTDDTSGNKSKKWHKFDSWYMSLAGLPRHLSARQENIHFICCSDVLSALETQQAHLRGAKMTSCEFFAMSLYEEWSKICVAFVEAIKMHMPELLQKQKTHLIRHLVDCMRELGPSSAFSAERFESFNARVRAHNVYGNRRAPSRDIAHRFCVLQHLRYLCNKGDLSSGERCGDVVKEIYHSVFMQHVVFGIPMQDVQQKASLCTWNTTKEEKVVEYRAIISHESSLVNSGDYKLVSAHNEMLYGILLNTFKTTAGNAICLIQGFQFVSMNDEILLNNFECPMLQLSKTIFTTPGSNVKRAVTSRNSICLLEATEAMQFIISSQLTSNCGAATATRCQ
eukprot:Em0023g417a